MSLTNWFHSVRERVRGLARRPRWRDSHQPPRAALQVEALEDRSVPTASFGSAFGITGSDTTGEGVATDGAGNVYMAGQFRGTRDFDPGAGVYTLTAASSDNSDGYIAKYAADGSLVWALRIGGVEYDNVQNVAVDAAGNVYICGSFEGTADFGALSLTSQGAVDVFAAKLDSSGNVLWAKALGGPYDLDFAGDIAVDASGNVYVTGGVDKLGTNPNAQINIFVAKFDGSGNLAWNKEIGNTSPNQGHGIAVDSAGNVVVTGSFRGTVDFNPGAGTYNLSSGGRAAQPSTSAFVLKLNSAGAFVWADAFQSSNSSGSAGYGLAIDASNNVYVTGTFSGTVDFDPGKGKLNLPNAGSSDLFVVKLDSGGKLVWAKSMGGPGSDGNFWGDIALDSVGNVYLTGRFQGTADFDPGSAVSNLSSVGSDDIFVAKLTSAGAFDWAVSAGSSGSDTGRGIAVDGSGNVYTTGTFSGTVDFDPSAGLAEVTGPGAFLWKLTQP